jgi:SAM-dependent methyltransferase
MATPRTHSGTSAHYETLLAELYAWMVGDLGAAEHAALAELIELGVELSPRHRRVLDLGSGLGLHAAPLAALGWDVTAVDSSAALLRALAVRAPRARTVHADLGWAAEHVDGRFELVLCMGDTLTHLDSEHEVERALAGAAERLALGGRLVLRFRDYVSRTLTGPERFFLVRADATRILTCCLDYELDRVLVTDVVHERADDESWTMRASSYRKLRLHGGAVAALLSARGLEVTVTTVKPPWIEMVAISRS